MTEILQDTVFYSLATLLGGKLAWIQSFLPHSRCRPLFRKPDRIVMKWRNGPIYPQGGSGDTGRIGGPSIDLCFGFLAGFGTKSHMLYSTMETSSRIHSNKGTQESPLTNKCAAMVLIRTFSKIHTWAQAVKGPAALPGMLAAG